MRNAGSVCWCMPGLLVQSPDTHGRVVSTLVCLQHLGSRSRFARVRPTVLGAYRWTSYYSTIFRIVTDLLRFAFRCRSAKETTAAVHGSAVLFRISELPRHAFLAPPRCALALATTAVTSLLLVYFAGSSFLDYLSADDLAYDDLISALQERVANLATTPQTPLRQL